MTADESHDSFEQNPAEKRRYPRRNVPVQVELHLEEVATPFRTSTSETSLGGCYVETMFTLAVGTLLRMTLWLGDEKVETEGRIATCFPQVGNGIEFKGMSADAQGKLERYLAEHETE